MNNVNIFLLKLHVPSIFFDTVCTTPTSIKSSAYRCIVRPILEYSCPVWHPHTAKNIDALESVQRQAARWASNSRWIPSSYCWSNCSDKCISELKWPTIQQCYIYFSICHIHDSLHHQNSLPFCKHFKLSYTSTRSHPYLFGLSHLLSILFAIRSLLTTHFCGTLYLIPLKSHPYSI